MWSGKGLLNLSLGGGGDTFEDDEVDEPLPVTLPSTISTPYSIKTPSITPLFSLNLDQVEEDEEDMPLLPAIPIEIEAELPISQDFIDAQRSIDENMYDVGAWAVYIDEVNKRKSGTVTIPEAYSKLVEVFPRSPKHWKVLVQYYLDHDQITEAEKAFLRADLHKCRSVDLWVLYIDMLLRNVMEKKKCEELFEDALGNVGFSIDSGVLWRKYLDYISEIRDPTRLLSLRRIYQRALSIPMDSIDVIWAEYEKLERSAGEHLADQLLPEYLGKSTQAKRVYRDRKKLLASCDMARLAVPPSSNPSEHAQLDAWNKIFKYEVKNLQTLDPEQQKQYILLLYDVCLCSFRLFPEIWVALANFAQYAYGITASRIVFKDAIDIVPSSELLRVAAAEIEEQFGTLENSRELLRNAVAVVPSTLVFTSYQKFLRRNDGTAAARKAFSDYCSATKRGERTFDGGVCIAHAQLELEVNNEPVVALKVLEYAKTMHPAIVSTVGYVRTMTKVLMRLGDHAQLQWLFTSILEPAVNDEEAEALQFSPQDVVELWEEYFKVEATLGLSSLSRMNELRASRTYAQSHFEDFEGSKGSSALDVVGDVTQGALSILERYGYVELPMLDSVDGGVLSRCLALSEVQEMPRHDRKVEQARRRSRREEVFASESLRHVTVAVKELLVKLPAQSVPPQDVGGFLDGLRKLVLPSRPEEELPDSEVATSMKRSRPGEFNDDNGEGQLSAETEDVFQRRQKVKYGL